jgi:DNA anti-recombination protein RmuC
VADHNENTARTNGSSGSVVEAIAAHERALLAQIDQADADAQRQIQEARAEASQHLHQEDEKIAEEVSARRRTGEQARDQERQAILSARDTALAKQRDEATARIPGVVDEVVARIVPNAQGGATA